MTALLYEYVELDERVSKSYRLWKGCHIASYVLAAVFGLLNFCFLQQTMTLVDGQCPLSPHRLVFRQLAPPPPPPPTPNTTVSVVILNAAASEGGDGGGSLNTTLYLEPTESQFQRETHCDLPLYTPLLSTIFGIVWITLFTICGGGGRSRHGMSEPWRIVCPALVFALVLVLLTGHNMIATNSGLRELCRHFHNVTGTDACTRDMDTHVRPVPAAWAAPSVAVGATRAACAGVWACWAAACALLVARCLAAADFSVRRTQVRLHADTDPTEKLLPTLDQQRQVTNDQRQRRVSPRDQPDTNRDLDDRTTSRDDDSILSDPTTSTELNTVSVTAPASARKSLNEAATEDRETPRDLQSIDLFQSPKESSLV